MAKGLMNSRDRNDGADRVIARHSRIFTAMPVTLRNAGYKDLFVEWSVSNWGRCLGCRQDSKHFPMDEAVTGKDPVIVN
jgi:hypothetical protein